MFDNTPSTIAGHNKIAPFDIAKTPQLLEERLIERIAAKCGCGNGRTNKGDAIGPRGSLCLCHDWPSRRSTYKSNKFTSSHPVARDQDAAVCSPLNSTLGRQRNQSDEKCLGIVHVACGSFASVW